MIIDLLNHQTLRYFAHEAVEVLQTHFSWRAPCQSFDAVEERLKSKYVGFCNVAVACQGLEARKGKTHISSSILVFGEETRRL